MARTVAVTIHFVAIATGYAESLLWAVEMRRGGAAMTIGRIAAHRDARTGRAAGWHTLRVGSTHWTAFRSTRKLALDDMLGMVDEALERDGAWGNGTMDVYRPAPCTVEGITFRAWCEREIAVGMPGGAPTPAAAAPVDAPCGCWDCRRESWVA